jgi:hypothetical protein
MRFARQCTDLTVKVYEQLFLMRGYASVLKAIYFSAGIAANPNPIPIPISISISTRLAGPTLR